MVSSLFGGRHQNACKKVYWPVVLCVWLSTGEDDGAVVQAEQVLLCHSPRLVPMATQVKAVPPPGTAEKRG